MKTSKVLHNLRSELVQLSKSFSDRLLSQRLFLIAMDFDAEFLTWVKGQGAKKSLAALTHPVVLDTLRFIDTMLESHPDGISKPDFVKYFVGTNNSKYLPTILSFSEIYQKSGSAILEPFEQILSHTDIFHSVGESDVPLVEENLREIENEFRKHTQGLVNKPYGDLGGTQQKPTKLTKNEKKRELFLYLIDEASQQIVSILDSNGFDVLADSIRSDRMFLVNPKALSQSRLTGLPRDRSYMVLQAQDVAKTILKRTDLDDYEFNYNLLINSAMRFNTKMTDQEYHKYFYDLMLEKGRGTVDSPPRVEFNQRDWVHPTFVEFTSLVLTMLMSQVKL